MAGLNPGEMEDFQRLSDRYQPDLPVSSHNTCTDSMAKFSSHQGPLVGEKLPMSKLVEEYTAADPTYVAKTLVSLMMREPGLAANETTRHLLPLIQAIVE